MSDSSVPTLQGGRHTENLDVSEAPRVERPMVLHQRDQLISAVQNAIAVGVMVDAGAREALQVVDPALQVVGRRALQLQLVTGPEVGDPRKVVEA